MCEILSEENLKAALNQALLDMEGYLKVLSSRSDFDTMITKKRIINFLTGGQIQDWKLTSLLKKVFLQNQ